VREETEKSETNYHDDNAGHRKIPCRMRELLHGQMIRNAVAAATTTTPRGIHSCRPPKHLPHCSRCIHLRSYAALLPQLTKKQPPPHTLSNFPIPQDTASTTPIIELVRLFAIFSNRAQSSASPTPNHLLNAISKSRPVSSP
jgi:hypothetical protein